MLQDNFYTVQLGQQMLRALDELARRPDDPAALARFREALTREAGNVTETGEKELVDSLTVSSWPPTSGSLARPRPPTRGRAPPGGQTYRMIDLNIEALDAQQRSRATATATHAAATTCWPLLGLSAAELALGFVLSVPAAAVAALRS